ncbi:MAG: hypothetical protein U1F66_04690 [bacterium]
MATELAALRPALQREYQAIAAESDRQLKTEALQGFARRLEAEGSFSAAAELYARLAAEAQSPEASRLARDGLDRLRGRGGFGSRLELQFQPWIRQAADPRLIAPMLVGALAFQLGRAVVLGRLSSLAEASWLTRGAGARAAAGLAGFAAEVPSFVAAQRALMPEPAELATDLRNAALALGAMKLFAATGRWSVQSFPGLQGRMATAHLAGINRLSHVVIPEVGALLGLMATHRLETTFGWRPAVDPGMDFADSLLTLFSLRMGEGLGRLALGPGFAAFRAELGLRGEFAASGRASGGYSSLGQPAWAGTNAPTRTLGVLAERPTLLMMSGRDDGTGRRGPLQNSAAGTPYREGGGSPAPENAIQVAKELRQAIRDGDIPPAERLQYLETLARILPNFGTGEAAVAGLKDLERILRKPKVSYELPRQVPSQVTPYYGYDCLLRSQAAELSLKVLANFPRGARERERFAAALRETILEPQIPTRFLAPSKNPEWGRYYAEAESHLRRTLFPYYPQALRDLPTEAYEVAEGLKFLSSPAVSGLYEDPADPRAAQSAQEAALAYAALLAASSPYQRNFRAAELAALSPLLASLAGPAAAGDEAALRALAEAGPGDPRAIELLTRLRLEARDPHRKETIHQIMAAAQELQEIRHQEIVEKYLARDPQKRGLLYWLEKLIRIRGYD